MGGAWPGRRVQSSAIGARLVRFVPPIGREGVELAMPDAPETDRAPSPNAGARFDPHLYLHPQTLAKLSTMALRAKMIVEGVRSGSHRSPYSGVSVEFAHHRPYTPGDEIKHLDWKVFARTDKLQVKQYQQETNLDLVLLVDASGSMRFGSRLFADASGSARQHAPDGRTHWSKYDHATATAAALAHITLTQQDRVGLAVFADEIRAMVPRSGRSSGWKPIVDALAAHPVGEHTDIERVMDQAIAKLGNRCMIALISDCFMDPEALRAALAKAKHRGHELMILQVLDHAEREFVFEDRTAFEGLELEPTIRIDPRALRDDYLQALGAHIDAIEKDARSLGFDHHIIDTHEWLGPAIAAFIAKRNALLRAGVR